MMKKENKSWLKKSLIIYALVLTTTILISSNNSFAETSKYRIFSYISKMEVMKVGFVKAPADVLFERRGLVSFENGDVGIYVSRGTLKATPTSGKAKGFGQITHTDGSTAVSEFEVSYTVSPDTKLNTYTGTGKFIDGTGRFEGIQGELSVTGQALTPYDKDTLGDAYFDVISNYTLPPR